MTEPLKAPFPWFGGKSRVADKVWERFGVVSNYVEPFFGSGAVLLSRPDHLRGGVETINDLDGFVANFWRATQADPTSVAVFADNPVNENDLHARHIWLLNQREQLQSRLEGNPDFYDAKIAGWWVWGISSWIGSGWCSGNGPWVTSDDGRLVLGDAGRGVNRQLPHLGNAGMGVNRQLPHLGNAGMGAYFAALRERLRYVRVCCGDWSRVTGPSVTYKHGITAVFLDPPYNDDAQRASNLYTCDSSSVSRDVMTWAVKNGDNPTLRIALCGYEGEHVMPTNWTILRWKAEGGYGSQALGSNINARRERIWFSPHCLMGTPDLFSDITAND